MDHTHPSLKPVALVPTTTCSRALRRKGCRIRLDTSWFREDSDNRHRTARAPPCPPPPPPGSRNQDTRLGGSPQSHWVTVQKEKLKTSISFITVHRQSPNTNRIRSKHQVNALCSVQEKKYIQGEKRKKSFL